MVKRFTPLLAVLLIIISFAKAQTSKEQTATKNNSGEPCLYAAVIEPQPGKSAVAAKPIKKYRIYNLGSVINTKDVEYAPTISADGRTLYYVSNRAGSIMTKRAGEPSHDFWKAKKTVRIDTVFASPYNIDVDGKQGVNTAKNEGAASISADGSTLFFTGCYRADGYGKCDIYKVELEGEKWGRPMVLPKSVNTEYWESQPSISPDKSRLFFVSNRPGSHGSDNYDIWYSDYDFDKDEWAQAKPLDGINTDGREFSPFIAADGVTLYFASDGHEPSYGGLDFFVTTVQKDGSCTKPENLNDFYLRKYDAKLDLNTSNDEQFISMPAARDVIYFASKRTDIYGAQGDFDLYMAVVPSFDRNVNVAGNVIDECSRANIPAVITIKNKLTGRIFKDSVSLAKPDFSFVVMNSDYGDIKDSVKAIEFEVTATNPKYGSKTFVQKVNKPAQTQFEEDVNKFADEIKFTITMGQKPVLASTVDMDKCPWFVKNKKKPEIASFKGLVLEKRAVWNLYPLLNYVFFDEGKSDFLTRYKLFSSYEETKGFDDEKIPGQTLDKYYHILNIFGFRLTKNPDLKITVTGCNDGTTDLEKNTKDLSKSRATLVYNYLRDVWKISPDRMELIVRDKPSLVSNLKDPDGIQENRRVEITTKNESEKWILVRPILDKDPKVFPLPVDVAFDLKNGVDDEIIAKRRVEIKRGDKLWKIVNLSNVKDEKEVWDWKDENGKYPTFIDSKAPVDDVPYTAQLIVTIKNGSECVSEPITLGVKHASSIKSSADGTGDKNYTMERYNLILFPFDSPEAGPLNTKIMEEYIYPRTKDKSKLQIVGHTDIVGLEDHNLRLSQKRAQTAERMIKGYTKGKYEVMNTMGVGEGDESLPIGSDDPNAWLYPNNIPEGRFYNRTVQIQIQSPIEAE